MKKVCLVLFVTVTVVANLFAWGPEPQHYMGNEYYICDEPLNVRDNEGFSGNKIDKLYVGEKVKILGYGNSEKIDGDYGYYWTNIEFHNGKTGWIYGKYIATKTLICDFDENGIDDYIFIREKNLDFLYSIDYPDDVMVYMNGKLMEMPELDRADFSHTYYYLSENGDKAMISIENTYDDMPTPDEFISDLNTCIYLILITEDSVEFVDVVTDSDCHRANEIDLSSELKAEYIEPYLGRNYSFLR